MRFAILSLALAVLAIAPGAIMAAPTTDLGPTGQTIFWHGDGGGP